MANKKRRKISSRPISTRFRPHDWYHEEIELGRDELEAIRLSDLEELSQAIAAKRMNISQSTFHRMLKSARKKIAEALLKGKALNVK